MMGHWCGVLKSAVTGYIDDNALSRGAAIAYYTIVSIAPVLVIVIAIAGLVVKARTRRAAPSSIRAAASSASRAPRRSSP